jgi:hypothetical protein
MALQRHPHGPIIHLTLPLGLSCYFGTIEFTW